MSEQTVTTASSSGVSDSDSRALNRHRKKRQRRESLPAMGQMGSRASEPKGAAMTILSVEIHDNSDVNANNVNGSNSNETNDSVTDNRDFNDGNRDNIGDNSNANNEGNSEQLEVITINDTCIDLTDDTHDIVDDPEVECIHSIIRNPGFIEVPVIVQSPRRRSRALTPLRHSCRSRSPIKRRRDNDDIIDITQSQNNTLAAAVDSEATNSKASERIVKCPICLEDEHIISRSGRQIVSTICGHIFCDRCIKEAIKTSKMCPNCRKKLNVRNFHPIFI